MLDIRCECGKIICQSEHKLIVIKCRHCKRLIFIKSENDSPKVTHNPHFNNKAHIHHYPNSKHA